VARVVTAVGFDDSRVADRESVHSVPDVDHSTGELVTHGHWEAFASEGVRVSLVGNQNWPPDVLVQVCTADAAPLDLDLHLTGRYFRFLHVLES